MIALFSLWERELGIPVIASVSGGTAVTVKKMGAREIDVYRMSNLYFAYHGLRDCEELGPSNIRYLAYVMTGLVVWSTLEGSGIEKLEDLAGKKVR